MSSIYLSYLYFFICLKNSLFHPSTVSLCLVNLSCETLRGLQPRCQALGEGRRCRHRWLLWTGRTCPASLTHITFRHPQGMAWTCDKIWALQGFKMLQAWFFIFHFMHWYLTQLHHPGHTIASHNFCPSCSAKLLSFCCQTSLNGHWLMRFIVQKLRILRGISINYEVTKLLTVSELPCWLPAICSTKA